MKFITSSLIFVLLITSTVFGQNVIKTAQDMRNYFAFNINALDPIVGEYDVETSGDYITPFVHQKINKTYGKLFIFQDKNGFRILDDSLQDVILTIEKIGETNAYRLFYHTSPSRIYLQDKSYFKAAFELDHSSAKQLTGNSRLAPSVRIYLNIEAIKIYPTPSMYKE